MQHDQLDSAKPCPCGCGQLGLKLTSPWPLMALDAEKWPQRCLSFMPTPTQCGAARFAIYAGEGRAEHFHIAPEEVRAVRDQLTHLLNYVLNDRSQSARSSDSPGVDGSTVPACAVGPQAEVPRAA
jgi:hypothetical protein